MKTILSALVVSLAGFAWIQTYLWIGEEQHQATMLFLSFAATSFAVCSHRHGAVAGGGHKTEETAS